MKTQDREQLEITAEMVDRNRDDWNTACLQMGIPAIRTDTCARIMAVLYMYGNNEYMVYNKTFLADVRYIQDRFGLHGAGTLQHDFAVLLKQYVKELEDYEERHKEDAADGALFKSHIPAWASKLFDERYGIKLIN